MNRNDRRMADNILNALSGVKEINRNELNYSSAAKAFLAAHTTSSSQATEHSIDFLVDMASVSFFSNISRFLKDRYIKKEDIQFLSKEFLKNINTHYTEQLLSSILKDALHVKNASGENFIDFFMAHINSLTYSQLRTIENMLGNALIILHHLGPLKKGQRQKKERFSENSLETLFLIGKMLVPHWPSLVAEMPNKSKMLNSIRKINNFLLFLKTQLYKESSQDDYHNFINESFYLLKRFLLINDRDHNLIKLYTNDTATHTKKLALILNLLEHSTAHIDKDRLHHYLTLILTILNDSGFKFGHYLNYLNLSAYRSGDRADGPYLILRFLIENFGPLYENRIRIREDKATLNLFHRLLAPFSLRLRESLPSPIQ